MSATLNIMWVRMLKVLALMVDGNGFKTCYIWGPPGIGKTWAAYETAQGAYYSLTLTPETPASELRGMYMPTANDDNTATIFKWHDGVVIRAMREGARLVINEVSHAGIDAMAFLHPILEGKGTCQITLPTGETVVGAKGFNIIGTDNCSPDDLPDAVKDRWNVCLYVDTYAPAGLAGLGDRVRVWASRSEIAYEDGRWISLRDWYSLESSLEQGFELEESCLMVFGELKGANVYTGLAAYVMSVNQNASAEAESSKHVGAKRPSQSGGAGSIEESEGESEGDLFDDSEEEEENS